jgi:5-methylcytosine-specific restriction endonuclease McrA
LGAKACRGCGADKGLSEFYECSGMADGHLNHCKSCVKARTRNYRLSHREQYAQYEKARANLPHRIEARRKYQEEHKEQISEYKQSWSAINSQRVPNLKRDYYQRNREEVISRSKKWAEKNAEKVKAAKANNRRKRRAAKNGDNGHFTAEEFDALCSVNGYACLCCGATDRKLEADHVVFLTRGGSDGIENIQPLCGECNGRKFTAIIDYRPKVAQ